MIKLSLTVLAIVMATFACAQVNPAQWTFSFVKTGGKTGEIHCKVILDKPWHIYSQTTPRGGPNPTVLQFAKHPLVTTDGKSKELGQLMQKYEEAFNVHVKYYEDRVEFVQKLKLKGNIKTNLSGTISYMICNNEKCLPPATQHFEITIDN